MDVGEQLEAMEAYVVREGLARHDPSATEEEAAQLEALAREEKKRGGGPGKRQQINQQINQQKQKDPKQRLEDTWRLTQNLIKSVYKQLPVGPGTRPEPGCIIEVHRYKQSLDPDTFPEGILQVRQHTAAAAAAACALVPRH